MCARKIGLLHIVKSVDTAYFWRPVMHRVLLFRFFFWWERVSVGMRARTKYYTIIYLEIQSVSYRDRDRERGARFLHTHFTGHSFSLSMKMLNICSKIKCWKSIFPMTHAHTHTPHLCAFRPWYYTTSITTYLALVPRFSTSHSPPYKKTKITTWRNCQKTNAKQSCFISRGIHSAMVLTDGST